MKKAKTDSVVLEAEAPVYRPGGTDRSIAELEAATHRLTMRRIRDMLPGKIETRRLVLRAPMRGDVPEIVKLAGNKNVSSKLARMPHPYSGADAIAFIEILAQRADERPYAITLDGKFIGVIGLSFYEGRAPELGYWLGEPHWGRRYATEAGRALIEAAHRIPHVETIAARVLPDNLASLRVLEKLGFHRAGKGKPASKSKQAANTMILLELKRPRWM
jgi:RimJ/RimL family protein N-acetyltransferase